MDEVSSFSDPDTPQPVRVRPLDWARGAGVDAMIEQAMNATVRRRHRRMMVGGLTALVAIFSLTLTWRATITRSGLDRGTAHAFVLSPAQQRLPDGTVVELKDNAAIAVDYGGPFRRVTLLRGEA